MAVAIRVPLKFGLVADVLSDEERDRSAYVPPPVSRDDHHAECQCGVCIHARQVPHTPKAGRT